MLGKKELFEKVEKLQKGNIERLDSSEAKETERIDCTYHIKVIKYFERKLKESNTDTEVCHY
jgi:hypothetical protein